MCIISREATINALRRMKDFHRDTKLLYSFYGMNLLDDLGRRNVIMSSAQEKFFADALGRDRAQSVGTSGQPDIIVSDDSGPIEIECKLITRSKGGSIAFQTDYATLAKKRNLDYLYVVADPNFDEFAVLYFTCLTLADFREPSASSRGKA